MGHGIWGFGLIVVAKCVGYRVGVQVGGWETGNGLLFKSATILSVLSTGTKIYLARKRRQFKRVT